MKFIGENQVKGEMSDEEFLTKVNEIAKTRDVKKYGRDGNLVVYEELYHYKKIPYWIRIVRYYQIGIPLNQTKGMNWLTKWAVLERPEELKDLANFLEDVQEITGVYEWMWRDTLHVGQEDWTLKQMVDRMHVEAHECIDELPKIKSKIEKRFTEILAKLDSLMLKAYKDSS